MKQLVSQSHGVGIKDQKKSAIYDTLFKFFTGIKRF